MIITLELGRGVQDFPIRRDAQRDAREGGLTTVIVTANILNLAQKAENFGIFCGYSLKNSHIRRDV